MGRKKLYPFNKCMRGYVANGILNFTDSAFFVLNKICGIYPRQHILERNKNQYFNIDIFGDGIKNKNPSAPRNNRLDINITDVGFFYGDSRVINGVNARFISH